MNIRANFQEVVPFLQESWSMGWPMILIMFFQFAIGLTDVWVAGYWGPRCWPRWGMWVSCTGHSPYWPMP